ncbi:pyridoxal phosphate-dependent transferase [Bisporella sp. PMI_857]|nr:pyridoxal phosphate-dependent transferase [Bisporella sp. PMI_857]
MSTRNKIYFLFRPYLRPRSVQSHRYHMLSFTMAAPKKQINLLRGWPSPTLLPTSAIQTAANSALSDPAVIVPGLLYGPDPGYQPLRESIARWLSGFHLNRVRELEGGEVGSSSRSGDRTAQRICISGGASQGLACLLQVFSDPGVTRVWMVAPCYFLACRIFGDAGLRLRAVSEGEEGIDLEALERGIQEVEREGERKTIKQPKPWGKIYKHIVYCVPTFSNPSGRTMSLSTRQSLVRLARKYDALIIADDVYDFLQWPAIPTDSHLNSPTTLRDALLPRLVDVDRTLEPRPGPDDFGNAVSNGSFSKIVGPGVRTGWTEATPKFTYGVSQCGSSRSGGAPSQLTATIIDSLLSSGALTDHVEKVLKPSYQKRHAVITDAVTKHLVPLGVVVQEGSVGGNNIFGGYFIWLELPKNVDADVLTVKSQAEQNLIVAPGKLFEVRGDERIKFPNSVRLCFAYEAEADLLEGVQRLATVVQSLLNKEEGGVTAHGSINQQDLGEYQ